MGELLTDLQPGLFRCSDVGARVWCDQLFQALDLLTGPNLLFPSCSVPVGALRGCCLGTLLNPWVWPLLRL